MGEIIERAKKYRAVAEETVQTLAEDKALEVIDMFPSWDGNSVAYTVGFKARYDGVLYKCLQAHTSQSAWTPTAASSLWAKVLIVSPDVIPEWEQPDSTNAYMKGDKVKFDGKIYQSLIDNNVWSPSAYAAGWQEVTE